MAEIRMVTVRLPVDIWDRLQTLRGKRLLLERENVTTTDVMIRALEKGLTSEERRVERAGGPS
jgi:hypothetical protein